MGDGLLARTLNVINLNVKGVLVGNDEARGHEILLHLLVAASGLANVLMQNGVSLLAAVLGAYKVHEGEVLALLEEASGVSVLGVLWPVLSKGVLVDKV